MNLVVFGATGPTGRQVMQQALERGHQVTAFARRPEALSDLPIRVATGDAGDAEAVEAAVQGQEGVVCVLGPRNRTARDRAAVRQIASIATGHIISAMVAHRVRRLVVQSAVGVGSSRGRGGLLFERVVRPLFLREQFADKERQEELVRRSGLDWVIVRPMRLVEAPARGAVVASTDEQPVPPRIPRADVARFILDQLETDTYLGQAPLIGG